MHQTDSNANYNLPQNVSPELVYIYHRTEKLFPLNKLLGLIQFYSNTLKGSQTIKFNFSILC